MFVLSVSAVVLLLTSSVLFQTPRRKQPPLLKAAPAINLSVRGNIAVWSSRPAHLLLESAKSIKSLQCSSLFSTWGTGDANVETLLNLDTML